MTSVSHALSGWRRIDDFAKAKNWITGLDPRAKTIAALATIIIMAGSSRYAILELLPLLALPLCMMYGGRIPPGWVLRRVLVALPFAIMIGLLNPWLDTTKWDIFLGWQISAGWVSFFSIILRCIISVSIAVILLATTGISRFTYGLSRLGVPSVIVTQVLILYRYAFIIGEEVIRMQQAWQLRSLNQKPTMTRARILLPVLFHRSANRGLRTHNAMLARGFDGVLPQSTPLRWQFSDTLWVVFWICYALFVRFAAFEFGWNTL